MPQAGVHAIVGTVSRKWFPRKEWLLLGLVLGNFVPDLDNLAVAVATVMKAPVEGLHRTFTHSLFTVLAVVLLFFLISILTKNEKWNHLGLGLGAGILMHIALDLVAWFNGVELLWPVRYELNFWGWFVSPEWLAKLLETGEFLAFGAYFLTLAWYARRQGTDTALEPAIRRWAYVMLGLFVVFLAMDFLMKAGFQTIFGAAYLLALLFVFFVTIRMRRTIESP